MSGFDVTAAELQAAGRQVREVADDVRTALAGLAGRVTALCDGGWRGRAADAFVTGWDEWRAGAASVVDALEHMGQLLGATGQGYEAAEVASLDGLPRTA